MDSGRESFDLTSLSARALATEADIRWFTSDFQALTPCAWRHALCEKDRVPKTIRDMKTQLSDTDPEIEKIQISLIRRSKISDRISLLNSLSRTVINLLDSDLYVFALSDISYETSLTVTGHRSTQMNTDLLFFKKS